MSDETTKAIPVTSGGIMETISDLIRLEMEGIKRMQNRLDELEARVKNLGANLESKENVPQKEQ